MLNESSKIELKEELNEHLEKEVVSFLNSKYGGTIFIGVKDNGEIVGIDEDKIDDISLKIKDRIKNNISPSTLGLFEINMLDDNNKKYIEIVISSGSMKPYFIKKKGLSSEGCYLRIGTSAEKMDDNLINDFLLKRNNRGLTKILSPNQNLTFNYLKEAYINKGFEIYDNFLKQLELYLDDKFNYLAFLVSDQNNLPFQYARYKDDDVFDLIEHKDFINQSIIKSTIEIIDLFNNKNTTYSKITSNGRIDKEKYNSIAIREIIVNAFVHNNYESNAVPIFEEFKSHLEISSFGGLKEGYSKEDFLNGYSLPVNPELIRIFRDLGLAERLGTGIRRVLKFYPKEIFNFSPNFLKVSIPFSSSLSLKNEEVTVLSLLKENPYLTREELSSLLNKNSSFVYREIIKLKENGAIKRIGSNKNGYWKILK